MPVFPKRPPIIEQLFRTGTALSAAGWLPATAALLVTSLAGLPRGAAAVRAAEPFAADAGPGAIGFQLRPQPGPRPESMLPDAFQPVEIRGPAGMVASIETAAGWSPLRPAPLRLALAVGQPYRLKIGGIPGRDGEEFFPSVRVLAKLDTPPGTAWRFPVDVPIDEEDVAAAAAGSHVRRVVYSACDTDSPDVVPGGWFDVKPGDDALEVARTLGDPVAEIILGNRLPARELLP